MFQKVAQTAYKPKTGQNIYIKPISCFETAYLGENVINMH